VLLSPGRLENTACCHRLQVPGCRWWVMSGESTGLPCHKRHLTPHPLGEQRAAMPSALPLGLKGYSSVASPAGFVYLGTAHQEVADGRRTYHIVLGGTIDRLDRHVLQAASCKMCAHSRIRLRSRKKWQSAAHRTGARPPSRTVERTAGSGKKQRPSPWAHQMPRLLPPMPANMMAGLPSCTSTVVHRLSNLRTAEQTSMMLAHCRHVATAVVCHC